MTRAPRWTPPAEPFTLANVAPLGVTRAMLRTAIGRGDVARLIPGVYIRSSALELELAGRHLQLALAHQVLRPRMIASHHTAALAWGLDLDDPAASAQAAATFIAPLGYGFRSLHMDGADIRVRRLPVQHRAQHPSGLLVTTPARTAVDVASTCDLPEALITLDSAARLALEGSVGKGRIRDAHRNERRIALAREPLAEAAEIAATQFTQGKLCGLVALADPRRESPLESLSYGRFLLAGLPLPRLQEPIRTSAGTFYPDFLWPDHMVIGEADGVIKYDSPDSLAREKYRQQVLETMGYRFVRWTGDEMRRRPAAVISRIAAALDGRERR